MIAALPVAVGRHIVDAGRIFAERPPRIADIVEEVGAEHVAPESPPSREPFAQHMHGAPPDLIDRANVPAQVMQPRRVRVRESDHVMVAAVNAVQKGDAVAGPVGEAQAKHPGIELDRALDVAGEEKDMRQTPGHDALNIPPERGAALARAGGNFRELRLPVGRGFRSDLDLHKVPVVIVEPQAVRIDARRRVEPLDAQRLQPLGEAVEIIVENAVRDVPQLLARTLADGDPDMAVAARPHGEEIAVFVDLEAELAVEIPGDLKIGNGEMKPVDRMNAEFSGPPRRHNGAANGGHGVSSGSAVRAARRKAAALVMLHQDCARGHIPGSAADFLVGPRGQRPRWAPGVACAGGSSGSAVTGAGAAATVGLVFFFFFGCTGGGAGCSGELALPASAGGLSSGFGVEASAVGVSRMTTVPPLQAVSQISKIGCATPFRPGLSANIHPEKMRWTFFCSSISSTCAKASVCGGSVGGRE